MSVWAMIPARGGSKSILRKNLVPLAGHPLLDYGVRAAQASRQLSRIICSTDDRAIGERAIQLGIEISWRPAHLADDSSKVVDAARHLLESEVSAGSTLPEILVLVQPTSPFLLPQHIDDLVEAMLRDPEARSGQTVAKCPHNHHAWNQRDLANGRVAFHFSEERKRAYNKQSKPSLYVFGNLVAARVRALLDGEDFFVEPSIALEVLRPYDFDLDVADDLAFAEAIMRARLVDLPHMMPASPQPAY